MFTFLGNIFNVVLYYPLFNALIAIYDYLPGHDFGLAIIVLTVIIRIILYPLSVSALHSQIAIQKLQPKIQEIQDAYKNDKEKQAKETLELYKKDKINPFSGLFLVLLQLPILIALYKVFWNGLNVSELSHVYSFIMKPEYINSVFLGFIDLHNPNILFAIAAGLVQFLQTKMLTPQPSNKKRSNDISVMMQKQMLYLFPIITIIILLRLPSALSLYWLASGVFSIIQQHLIFKKIKTNEVLV